MLSTYSVPAVADSSLIWMMAVLSAAVNSLRSISRLFQAPGVRALLTGFSRPALISEMRIVLMSADQRSMRSLPLDDTSTAAHSRPS
jgi:hypothetical protein